MFAFRPGFCLCNCVRPTPALLLLILVSLCAHLALSGVRVTTSLYALSLHASPFTVGTLIAVFALFPMLLAVRTGRLVDRVGVIAPMAAGCGALIAGCALAALAPGLTLLYLAAALVGTGFMAVQVCAQHLVGTLSSTEQRAANFSWLSLGFSISGFSGPVLAGLLIDHARYGAAYLAFGGFAASALLLVAAGRKRGLETMPPLLPADDAPRAFDLLRAPALRRIYAVGILLAAAWDLFTFVLPLRGAQLGFSASTIGFILGSFSAATFLIRLVMPWVVRRSSEWEVLRAALLLAALCYASFPLLHSPAALMAAAAMLGIAVGSSQPNMLALLHHTAPAGRIGEALGIRITIGNACQVVLPLAFGGAGAALGLGVVFWAMALLIGAGVPLAWQRLPLAKSRKN